MSGTYSYVSGLDGRNLMGEADNSWGTAEDAWHPSQIATANGRIGFHLTTR
jgi:hypothetical protein